MMKNCRLSRHQPLIQGIGVSGGDNYHVNGPAVHTRGGAEGSANAISEGKGYGPGKASIGLTADACPISPQANPSGGKFR